jgi:hypothetical protein
VRQGHVEAARLLPGGTRGNPRAGQLLRPHRAVRRVGPPALSRTRRRPRFIDPDLGNVTRRTPADNGMLAA